MTDITNIRNIDWLVGWDGNNHVYLNDVDLVFEDGVITYIGKDYKGAVDHIHDGRNCMVMPGLINIHTHSQSEAMRKGITDETRSPGFWHSSLYEYLPVFDPVDEEGHRACLNVSLGELLLSGVTTMVDLSGPFDGWLDALADSGIRAVVAPFFRDAYWYTENGHELKYEWDTKTGRQRFETAQKFIEQAIDHPSSRLSGMLSPSQIDTCTEELLRDSYAWAEEKNLPWTTHAAQSATEFYEIYRRHGKTPIEWLSAMGVLTDRSIIAHAIYLDHHPWLNWTSRNDMDRLRDSGASVAHCPTVFSRRGMTLRTLGGYIRHGINIGLGTDTYPHNMLEEMRTAAMTARAISQSVTDVEYSDVFNAATIGGANALRREDIGRLEVGSKADIVCVDLKHPSMMPMREPLRNLIIVATERAIQDVYVNGQRVVKDGELTTIDLKADLERLEEAQKLMMSKVSERDWKGRNTDELAPMSFKIVDSI